MGMMFFVPFFPRCYDWGWGRGGEQEVLHELAFLGEAGLCWMMEWVDELFSLLLALRVIYPTLTFYSRLFDVFGKGRGRVVVIWWALMLPIHYGYFYAAVVSSNRRERVLIGIHEGGSRIELQFGIV